MKNLTSRFPKKIFCLSLGSVLIVSLLLINLRRPRSESEETVFCFLDLEQPQFQELKRLVNGNDFPGAESELRKYFSIRPAHQCLDFSYFHSKNFLQVSKNMLDNVYTIKGFEPVKEEGDLSWNENPYNDRNWQFQLHTLRFAVDLYTAYNATRDERFLSKLLFLIKDWIMDNDLVAPPSEFSWNDHSTAWRAMVFAYLWENVQQLKCDPNMMNLFLHSIWEHGTVLAKPDFYKAHSNHGLTQAMALLQLSLMFPEMKHSNSWLEIAKSRIEQQMAENISENGVHREQSPFYHFYVLINYSKISEYARRHSVHLSDEFERRLKKMMNFAVHITKPDGSIPMIGDTGYYQDIWKLGGLEPIVESRETVKFVMSKGTLGKMPEETSIVFPQTGYAILRSGWGEHERFDQERYLVFDIGPFGKAHGHNDAMTCSLYAFGEDLILDSGKYKYEREDVYRQYFQSTFAHNTVAVDREGQNRASPILRSWSFNEEYDYVEASHTNYAGVEHVRSILFAKPAYFIIIDELTSDDIHEYLALFHLHPKAKVHADKLNVEVANQNSVLKIIPLNTTGLSLNIVKGQPKVPIQGWISFEYGKKQPNPVLEYRKSGKKEVYITLLYPLPKDQSKKRIRAELDSAYELGKNYKIMVVQAGRRDIISISRENSETSIEINSD
jgi:hypothetical protein